VDSRRFVRSVMATAAKAPTTDASKKLCSTGWPCTMA
jgi:hypothetical protein